MAATKETELTDKQKRKAFNKKPQKSFKNILADPFSKYWPEVNVQERTRFARALTSLAPLEEMVAQKKQLAKNPNVILGLTTLVQRIKSRELSAAVFSSNLEPKFITRQIMTLALSQNPEILLLVVSNLEELMEETFGIKSYTLGLVAAGNTEFTAVGDVIKELTSRFPVPVQVKYSSGQRSEAQVTPPIIPKRKKAEPLLTTVDFDSLYLKRTDPDKKAWTPPLVASKNARAAKGNDASTGGKVVKQWSDFISLNDNGEDDDEDIASGPVLASDLNEERVRLKALLLSTKETPLPNKAHSEQAMDSCEEETKAENDDEDDEQSVSQSETPNPSIFLKPEQTSGNQWASLLRPDNPDNAKLAKLLKRKEKKQSRILKRKEKREKDQAVPFQPMKVHKIQPNPMRIKKKKFRKTKK